MTKKERIKSIYKILLLYENFSGLEQNQDKVVTRDSYLGYLDRMYIWFLGYGNEEIYMLLKGLFVIGEQAKHKTVKSTVFHIINLLEREA